MPAHETKRCWLDRGEETKAEVRADGLANRLLERCRHDPRFSLSSYRLREGSKPSGLLMIRREQAAADVAGATKEDRTGHGDRKPEDEASCESAAVRSLGAFNGHGRSWQSAAVALGLDIEGDRFDCTPSLRVTVDRVWRAAFPHGRFGRDVERRRYLAVEEST